ncbi:3-oxoacyl-[acyl-carrier-protein] synthase III C-terminal domain-containing protein [Peterkaempfera sp. SMS 1(5)a]|uniref:3-oxoacyl-[acyl-carrier-protein] synthase III C-terminal domain-containing protein n=1 Tax=Peterkaempfera podocarpi TaxID=3232308 RepID=UPI00366C4105
MKAPDVGIRAIGTCLTAHPTDARSGGSSTALACPATGWETTVAAGRSATEDALRRAGLSVAELAQPYYLVCRESPEDGAGPLTGRRVLDGLGVGRAYSQQAGHDVDGALLLLRTLAAQLASNRLVRRGLLLAPLHTGATGPADGAEGKVQRGAAVLLAEEGWPHNRIRAVLTRTTPYSRGDDRQAGTLDLDALGSLVDRVLRASHTTWAGIDRVALHTADPEQGRRFRQHFALRDDQVSDCGPDLGYIGSAGLLIALQRILDTRPPAGSKVLATALGRDGTWSAAVVEA